MFVMGEVFASEAAETRCCDQLAGICGGYVGTEVWWFSQPNGHLVWESDVVELWACSDVIAQAVPCCGALVEVGGDSAMLLPQTAEVPR